MFKSIKQLIEYDRAYAAGKPLISDAKYDKLREKAKLRHPDDKYFNKVGAKLPTNTGRKEIKLPILMGSLEKKRPQQIINWLEKLPKNCEYVLTPKLDGLAILLEYRDGILYKAYTRGEDGLTGFDVTDNLRHVQGVLPAITRKAKHSPIKGTLFIKGECVCHNSIFNKYFAKKSGGKYKSPRNFAVGMVNTLNHDTNTIKALQKLTFVTYGMQRRLNGKDKYHAHKMSELIQLGFHGFTTVLLPTRWLPSLWKDFKSGKLEQLRPQDYPPTVFKDIIGQKYFFLRKNTLTLDLLNELIKTWRDSTDLDVGQDGVVLEIAQHDIRKKFGLDDARPSFAFAVKPEAKDQITKVGKIKEIDWTLTARRLLKPVLVLKVPLEFNGAEIERISAHNAAFVKKFKLDAGIRVKIIRSGDVIPRVIGRI